MDMTGDFEEAIEEDETVVHVGQLLLPGNGPSPN